MSHKELKSVACPVLICSAKPSRMSTVSDFKAITSGFNALQSQLQKQFLRSQALQEDIELLSTNISLKPSDGKENPQLQETDHSFKHKIKSSILKNEYSDVIFKVYDKTEKSEEIIPFFGIRALYAMHSTVFAEMLFKVQIVHMNKPLVIEIRDKHITPQIFEIITHLFYGLIDVKSCLKQQNAINLLYAANKFNINLLKEECFEFITKQMRSMNYQIICSIINKMVEMKLFETLNSCLRDAFIAKDANFESFLQSENEYILKSLSIDSINRILFDSVFTVSSEFQWIACSKWSKYHCNASRNWKDLMKEFVNRIDYKSMSGRFFLSNVPKLGILNNEKLVEIMQHFLKKVHLKKESLSNANENDEVIGFNEYDTNFSKIVVNNETTQIRTNGKRGCHWIWFANNIGWKEGKHSFSVKCKGLPSKHQTGNIIAIIGATNYQTIKKKDIWNKDECILDIDFDEEDSDDEENEHYYGSGEIVSMSLDWNGYLYKNDSMLINTENPWSINDEITVIIDIEGKEIKFFKNGNSVTDVDIVPSDDLVWFPILQCCGCKGHNYICQFR